ncbi:ribonuclease H-like domain-containing protein [Tanacetum coccineum]
MDSESAHMVDASKVPMLKPKNRNTAPKTTVVEGVEKVIPSTIAKEKAQKRLEVKARSTLMMGIPNKHQLKFNSIKDAKLLLEAIEKSSETLDQTFDRLQNLVTQLEILGETLSQEDVNQNLTNEAVNTAHGVSTVSNQVSAAKSINVDNLSDVMAMLTIRARRFLKNTRRMLTVNGNETIGFDKSKVECYNCHKRGHLARECRAPRNQDNRNKESSRRSVPVETTTSSALISCDGLGGYDWSDQAEESPTNYALVAYSFLSSDSEVSNDSTCSKSCLETVEVLKSQYEQLLKRFEKSELMVVAYKTGLQLVEERLEFNKMNEYVYVEKINGLKWDIQVGEITIGELRKKLKIVQKEKDGIQFNVDKFENASKSLNKIIKSQFVDNCKKGLGYNVVPPPLIGNFMPPKPDLSFTSLEEFTNESVVIKHVVENSEAKASEAKPKAVRKNNSAPIIEDWVSDSEEENRVNTVKDKKINTVRPKAVVNAARPKAVVNVARPKAVVNDVKGNNINVVKASACWVWKPKTKALDHGNPQVDLHNLEEMGKDNVADEAVNEEMDDSLERAATTATSLDAEQDRGGGPKHQETIGDTIAQTRLENVSKLYNDPLLARGNTLRSGEDSLKLNELMELCTNLQQMVLDLETTKTTQATEIASLKRRVKKLERRNKSRTHGLKRLYRVGSSRRVNVQTDEDMFGVNDLDGDEVIIESVDVVNTAEETRSVVEEVTVVTIPVSAATTTTTTTAITDVEMTLAQALAELKSAKPKADKVVIQEPEQGTTTPTLTTITTAATTITTVKVQDKGKGKIVEPEPMKKMSKKELLRLDKELTFKLQAKEEEEERHAREKAQQVEEANIA